MSNLEIQNQSQSKSYQSEMACSFSPVSLDKFQSLNSLLHSSE